MPGWVTISGLEDEAFYRIFLRSGVSQLTHYALNFFATDPFDFPGKGMVREFPRPLAPSSKQTKKSLCYLTASSFPVSIE